MKFTAEFSTKLLGRNPIATENLDLFFSPLNNSTVCVESFIGLGSIEDSMRFRNAVRSPEGH